MFSLLLFLDMPQIHSGYAVTGNRDWNHNAVVHSENDVCHDWFRFSFKKKAANGDCSTSGSER